MSHKLFILSWACAVCVTTNTLSVSHAADLTDEAIVTEQRRLQERQEQLQKSQAYEADVRLPTEPPRLQRLPAHEAICFTIDEIELAGDASDSFQWLLQELSGPDHQDDPLHHCLGTQGINLELQRAQDALVARGYVTSRVLAQPQDLTQHKLTLTLLVGRISAIRLTPDASPRATLSTVMPAKVGDILNLRDIEQALENLKRAPNAQADIHIVPGALPATSELLISYQAGPTARLSFTADDSGGKSTGIYQGSATLSLDNALLSGDAFYLSQSADLGGGESGPRGNGGTTVHYSAPLGYWTLGTTLSTSGYHQSIAGSLQDHKYHGTSDNAELKLSRMVYRDAHRKTALSLTAWQRKSNNFIDDTEVTVQRRRVGGWSLGLSDKAFYGDATLDTTLSWKRGTGDFDTLAAPEEVYGEGTSRMSLMTLDSSYIKPFKAGDHDWRYSANLHAQIDNTRLTPQDMLAIGGRATVRGFDGERSLSAENGFVLRNELALSQGASGAEYYLGVDYGQVGGPSTDSLLGNSLAGMALGLRGSVKRLQYEVFVATPLSKPSGFKTADYVAGFNLSISF